MIGFLGRLARGLVTGAVIIAVIAGTPWALLHYFGPPVPTSVPDLDTVREWFDNPNTSSHLLAVVLLAVWAGWAIFTYIIGVEVVATIRGVRAPRIRLAAPLHSVAAGLIGATATAVSSAAAQAAPPASPVVPASATAIDPAAAVDGQVLGPAGAVQPTVMAQADPQRGSAGQLRYEVVRGDWLVGIADRFLGDPDAYPRIAALNPNLAARDPRFPDHIEPGWVLVLPADAVDRGPIPHAGGIFTQPPAPRPPADPTPPTAPTTPPALPAPTTPPAPASSGPSAAVTAEPSTEAVSVYPQPDDDTDRDVDTTAGDGVIIGGNRIGAMSGAGLLASLALLALQAERRRQTQHRRPGQRLPNPRGGATERDLRVAEAPADVERLDLALRHLADALAARPTPPDIIGVRLIGGDVHLLLAAASADPPPLWLDEGGHWVLPGTTPLPVLPVGDRPLPTLTAVGSRAGRHVLLDLERLGSLTLTGDPERATALIRYMACELACNAWSEDAEIIVAGFGDDEAAWLKELNPHRVVLAASIADAAAQLRRHVTATRRALDALGLPDTLHGRLRGVAVDAWTPHVLLINNPGPHEQAVLTSLHRDLAVAGRSGAALVAAIPTGPAVGDASGALTADATLTVAAPHLSATTTAAGLPPLELEKVAEILRLARVTDLPTADEATDPPPSPTPVPAQPQPADLDIADATDVVRNLYDPDRWPTAPAPAPAAAVTAQRVRTTLPSPTGHDPTLDADLATWSATDANPPRIAILGRIDVATQGPAPQRRKSLHTEIAVFLAAHPRGASQGQIVDAIWPNGVNENTARGFLAAVRRWLATTPDGRPWLPDARETHNVYRLEPGYLLDWDLLRRLRARARRGSNAGGDDLRTALSLVRGGPLAGADTRSYGRDQYTWLGESSITPPHVLAAIIDAAHHLAELHLDQGDTAGARWAVQQAWTADPDRIDDQPWVDLMRAEQIDGNRAELRQLRDQLVSVRGYEVPEELMPETFEAIDKLIRD